MKALRIATLSILLTASTAFCGIVGSHSVGGLLTQADQVVVAAVRTGSSAAHALVIDLIVSRTLKGPALIGSGITATLSSPNVRVLTPGVLQMNGLISANLLVGRTGLWFLQRSGTEWVILPLMSGDISQDDLYLPVPSVSPGPGFTYDTSAEPKTKLIQEIGAAAQDPATAASIAHLEAMRVFADLGPGLLPMFDNLSASPQSGTMAMGLAGQIRLGVPSALETVANFDMGTFPQTAQSQLASAVCEYRNTDPSGTNALAVLLRPQYSDSMRACAAHALREIHSPQTLPLLEKLLEDSSPQIRYDAVIGIAQYAIGFPVARMEDKKAAIAGFKPGPNFTSDMYPHYPAQGLFLSNEQEYISYWKAWLAAHPAQ
ncbi:MAG: HEAT repeat domain-containing protein [Acidobacteriota bacterium]|nr:HEAT repeat domain-containing protein [Acidobacteriota bacterium]